MLVAGMMIGAYIFVNQKGYISRLWNTQAESLQEFIIENSVGARAAYVSGALGAYQRNPWMGVGLGASGFYIYRNLPDWALTMVPEIARQLNPENRLYPNPKNLYVRLLAETGLAGLFAFLAFQFTLLGEVVLAIRQKTRIWKFLGAAGLFTWFAVSFSNFTQDSFTNPNIWLNFGILAGTASFALQSNKTSRETP